MCRKETLHRVQFLSTTINHVSNSIHCKQSSFLAAHHYILDALQIVTASRLLLDIGKHCACLQGDAKSPAVAAALTDRQLCLV